MDWLDDEIEEAITDIVNERSQQENYIKGDPFKSEDDEELYNYLKKIFENTKIKDCVDINDYNHIKEVKTYIENGFINDKLDDTDNYKIMLMGLSGEELIGHVTALYIPKHIDILYIDGIYKIHLSKSGSHDLDLQELLDESKKLPKENNSFEEKYKRIVLMKPYIPEFTRISFDDLTIFYYETVIRDIESINFESTNVESESYGWMNTKHNLDQIASMSERGHLTFWVNYANDYIKWVDSWGEYGYDRKLIPRDDALYKFNKDKYYNKINKHSLTSVKYDNDKSDYLYMSVRYNAIKKIVTNNQRMVLTMYMKNSDTQSLEKYYNLKDYTNSCGIEYMSLLGRFQKDVKN